MDATEWYFPLLIFCARICDVSIGTIRTMLVISGHRVVSAALGFVEVTVWVLAVGSVINHLGDGNLWTLVGYAGGFATGVLVGMWLEERLALGLRIVRIISVDQAVRLSDALRAHGFRVTRVEGSGRTGPVEISFLVIRRRQLRELRDKLRAVNPKAFMTVERVDVASGGGFDEGGGIGKQFFDRFTPLRK
jgi:uncharacterized protein YebE (UPF0316 family)